MKNRFVVGLLLLMVTAGTPSVALAHDGKHSVWDFCKSFGNVVAWTSVTVGAISSGNVPGGWAAAAALGGGLGTVGHLGYLTETFLVHSLDKVDVNKANLSGMLSNGL